MASVQFTSDFLEYMIERQVTAGDPLPTLSELREELDVSVSKLREQLEVARALGLVEVRPRTGIRVNEYSFLPAVRLSLLYALETNRNNFQAFSALRTHIEVGFWHEAVTQLGPKEHEQLCVLVRQAWDKLRGTPTRIPHQEHRQFHTTIFSRLGNIFVTGLLDAFWEAYETVEYHRYADYEHLQAVWAYHERIANAIKAGDIEGSLVAFIEHTHLLRRHGTPGLEYPVAGLTSYILPPDTGNADTPQFRFTGKQTSPFE